MNRLRSAYVVLRKTVTKKWVSCVIFNNYVVQKPFTNPCNKFHCSKVKFSQFPLGNSDDARPKTIRNYMLAVTVMTVGLTYAAVPLYGIFCQMTGYGGTVQHATDESALKSLKKDSSRKIIVKFNSDVSVNMKWKFKPQQNEIQVFPGETALAFYTAVNPTEKPIIGVSTYNVLPFEAGPYFNKIQCFCFEEQILNPHEQVDMPVFFYIDPEFCEDPKMENVHEIVLSYTFFEAKEGLQLPIPAFLKQN